MDSLTVERSLPIVPPSVVSTLRERGILSQDTPDDEAAMHLSELRQYGVLTGESKRAMELAIGSGRFTELLHLLQNFNTSALSSVQQPPSTVQNPHKRRRGGLGRGKRASELAEPNKKSNKRAPTTSRAVPPLPRATCESHDPDGGGRPALADATSQPKQAPSTTSGQAATIARQAPSFIALRRNNKGAGSS